MRLVALVLLILALTMIVTTCSDYDSDGTDGDQDCPRDSEGNCTPDGEVLCETPPDWQSEDCYTCESDLDCAPMECCGGLGINKTCAPDCSQKGCASECMTNGLAFGCPREGVIRCIDKHCTAVYSETLSADELAAARSVETGNMGCYWKPHADKDYEDDCMPCQSDDDCVPAFCCRAQSAVNKTCAPFCDYTQCESCAPNTLDCGQNRIYCNENGHCVVEFDEQQDE
jgi:hypothetical protein